MYADSDEQEEMKVCHPRCIELMEEFLNSIEGLSLFRALDVAGGDGRFSKSLLIKHYDKVDLFDQCPTGVALAKKHLKKEKHFGYIDKAPM